MRVFSHFGWDKHVKHSLGSSGCVEWVPGSFFNTTLCRTGTKTGARKHCLCNKTILHIWTATFDIAFIFVDHVDTKYMCRFYRSLQRIKKHILKNISSHSKDSSNMTHWTRCWFRSLLRSEIQRLGGQVSAEFVDPDRCGNGWKMGGDVSMIHL